MPNVYIRDLSPAAYRGLRERAKRHRRSISQEAAMILQDVLGPPGPEVWDTVDRIRERLRTRYGVFPDSTPLVRADRDR